MDGNDRKSRKTAASLEEMAQHLPTESVLQKDHAGMRMPRHVAAGRINRAHPLLPRKACQTQEALPPPLRADPISTARHLRHYLIPPSTTVTRIPYRPLPVHSHVEIATTILRAAEKWQVRGKPIQSSNALTRSFRRTCRRTVLHQYHHHPEPERESPTDETQSIAADPIGTAGTKIPRDDGGRPSEGGRSPSRNSLHRSQDTLIINLYPHRHHLPIFLSHHLHPRPPKRNKLLRKTKAGAVKKESFDYGFPVHFGLHVFYDSYNYSC
jgi:hypothetical protein